MGGAIASPHVDRVMPRPRFKPGTDLFPTGSAETLQPTLGSGVISFDGSLEENGDMLRLLNDFEGGAR